MAQEQVDEGGEPPVVIHRLLCAGFAASATTRCPSLVLLGGNTVLPRSTLPEEPRSDSVHTVDRPPDLRIRVDGSTHHAGERHHAVRPPRLCWDRGRRPWTEPHRGRRTKNWQALLLVSRLLWRYRLWMGRVKRFRQLLAPLLLFLLELLWLLSTVLLLLRLLPRLLLTLLILFLPLLLDGANPGRLGRPSCNERSLGLLVHRTGIPRSPVAARPITYGNRIPIDPRSGGLGGSLLPLGVRCLDPLWQRGRGLTHQGAGRGVLGASSWSRVGGAYKTQKQRSVIMVVDARTTQIP